MNFFEYIFKQVYDYILRRIVGNTDNLLQISYECAEVDQGYSPWLDLRDETYHIQGTIK